jgi:hypothetical protein
MSVFRISSENSRLAHSGLPAGPVAAAAEDAILAGLAVNAQTRGVTFVYQGKQIGASRHQAAWAIDLLDDLGGRFHLFDLVREPVSYGKLKPAALFTTPSFAKRN